MIKLTCPSCGGSLELPDKNGIYHCMYCGTKIIIDQTQAERDTRQIAQLKELCKTALEMKNYEEVRDFANKVLELDTKDDEAWSMKGVGTFHCDPEKDAAFFEALGYLKKAHSLNPGNSETLKWRSILCSAYGLLKNSWGMKEYNTARPSLPAMTRRSTPK
jgi:DNA-directed RNA polymerase subunit RPC12/RpoP